jgi:hypothetical protein
MTLAKQDRGENLKNALRLLLQELGDEAIDLKLFDPLQPPLAEVVLSTTWDELESRAFIETVVPNVLALTGRGWIAALFASGELHSPAFQERIGIAFRTMKTYVGGRSNAQLVSLRHLARDTDLPEGWLFNVVEGRYLEEVSKRRGAGWLKKGRVIAIPVGFNVEPTDLDTLLQTEILKRVEELEERLEVTAEELGQYKCSYCGAPLISSGSITLDEHNDGYYQSFECGHYSIDGYSDQLCPLDPQFPQLNDFELRTQQQGSVWICTPIAKTRYAARVDLHTGRGRTEEEALQNVIARYAYVTRTRK